MAAGPNTVQFARVDASKVPKLGTSISTVGHGNVDLLPTEKNVLVIEAGCSAEKTRQVLAWIRAQLASDPKMPVIFLTTAPLSPTGKYSYNVRSYRSPKCTIVHTVPGAPHVGFLRST